VHLNTPRTGSRQQLPGARLVSPAAGALMAILGDWAMRTVAGHPARHD
jgi:hypothetical protein